MAELITGKNSVTAAVRSGQQINVLYLADDIDQRTLHGLLTELKDTGAKIKKIPRQQLDTLTGGTRHQGMAAEVLPFKYSDLEEILNDALAKGEEPLLLILDSVQDTMNLGAILRSAEAFGCHGVVVSKDRSAPVNDVVMRTSAGAAAFIKVARVTNLNSAIKQLKKGGFWVTGAEMQGSLIYTAIDYRGPVALVIGGEDHGIGRLLASNCDNLARIPLKGKTSSLNASVAAAVFLAEVARQRAVG